MDFIREFCPKNEAKYKELLTIDLYLRERVKSRPSFALDQRPYQTKLREILSLVGREKHVEVLLAWKESPIYLIFDYEKRDPLTKDAFIKQWKETKEES